MCCGTRTWWPRPLPRLNCWASRRCWSINSYCCALETIRSSLWGSMCGVAAVAPGIATLSGMCCHIAAPGEPGADGGNCSRSWAASIGLDCMTSRRCCSVILSMPCCPACSPEGVDGLVPPGGDASVAAGPRASGRPGGSGIACIAARMGDGSPRFQGSLLCMGSSGVC